MRLILPNTRELSFYLFQDCRYHHDNADKNQEVIRGGRRLCGLRRYLVPWTICELNRILTCDTLPGLNRHLEYASRAAPSSRLFPVLCSIRTPATVPVFGSIVTSTTPLP